MTIPKAFWPVTIVAGVNDKLDFILAGITRVATVAPATYLSATSLLAAVQAALTATIANGWAYTISTTGRVTLTGTGAFELRLGTGANVAISVHRLLGFADTDRISATSHTAPVQHANGWYPEEIPSDDTGDLARFVRGQSRSIAGRVRGVQFGGASYDRALSFAFLPAHKVYTAQEGAKTNEALERLVTSGWARFRWWPDAATEGTSTDYALDVDTASRILHARLSPGAAFYTYTLKLLRLP